MTELKYRHGVCRAEIQHWLGYWQRAHMVAIDEIRAFDQVNAARRFCSCMRLGRFAEVGDFEIWLALRDMRENPEAAQAAMDRWASSQTGV